ncbi:hypothetical protein HN011_009485 [Eciton burchellii]|nr:hypothetical protein HN011_009485 [Eciton burchellii]
MEEETEQKVGPARPVVVTETPIYLYMTNSERVKIATRPPPNLPRTDNPAALHRFPLEAAKLAKTTIIRQRNRRLHRHTENLQFRHYPCEIGKHRISGSKYGSSILAMLRCRYEGRRYQEGTAVNTSEPCLRCRCTEGALRCRLRVCPRLPNAPPPGCRVRSPAENVCCAELVCGEPR